MESENTSLAAIMVKGTSVPNVCAMPDIDYVIVSDQMEIHSTYLEQWQFSRSKEGLQRASHDLLFDLLVPFSKSSLLPFVLWPVRPSPVSLRAVQVDHPSQDREYVSEHLDTVQLAVDSRLNRYFALPIRSIFVMSRSSDVPVDICMAYGINFVVRMDFIIDYRYAHHG